MAAYKKLTVTVEDKNDWPRFNTPFYSTSLVENQPVGTSVMQVGLFFQTFHSAFY